VAVALYAKRGTPLLPQQSAAAVDKWDPGAVDANTPTPIWTPAAAPLQALYMLDRHTGAGAGYIRSKPVVSSLNMNAATGPRPVGSVLAVNMGPTPPGAKPGVLPFRANARWIRHDCALFFWALRLAVAGQIKEGRKPRIRSAGGYAINASPLRRRRRSAAPRMAHALVWGPQLNTGKSDSWRCAVRPTTGCSAAPMWYGCDQQSKHRSVEHTKQAARVSASGV